MYVCMYLINIFICIFMYLYEYMYTHVYICMYLLFRILLLICSFPFHRVSVEVAILIELLCCNPFDYSLSSSGAWKPNKNLQTNLIFPNQAHYNHALVYSVLAL
jgi:hypothetical protein